MGKFQDFGHLDRFNTWRGFVDAVLKYLLHGRLTKYPMTLSLGQTYVWWCPMTFSSVWLGNKSEWHRLMSAQCINSELNVVKILKKLCHSYLYSLAKINLLANNSSRLRQLKPVFHHFARRPVLDYIKTSFPVHFLYMTLILHLTYKPLVLD
jgi:hypothetical protein